MNAVRLIAAVFVLLCCFASDVMAQSGACCDTTSGECTATTTGAAGCACGKFYLGDGTSCAPGACAQGACCAEKSFLAANTPFPAGTIAGTCILTTQIGCTASSARYLGDGTTCLPNPCPTPGACCDPVTGACVLAADVQNCAAGSTFHGAGTTCTSISCGGACCHNLTGVCTTATGAGACPPGSTFQGNGTTCNPSVCIGACCNPATGACALVVPTNLNGCGSSLYNGPGTVCTPVNSCIGACCNLTTGACTLQTGANCGGTNFQHQGPGTTCTSNPCAGACCDNTTRACRMTLTASCPPGSTLVPAGVCTPDACGAGVCCNTATGACTIKTNAGCTGTTVYNAALVCGPANVCAGACCNMSTGACTLTDAASCPSTSSLFGTASSVFQGAGTVCTAGACAPGACCRLDGTCTTGLDSVACAAVGTFLGIGTTCGAGSCFGEVHTAAHNDRASALPVTLGPGDRMVGFASGGDRYWLSAPVAAAGIYRHTLTLSSASLTQGMVLPGGFQFDNHTSSTGNVAFSVGTDLSWYTFGNGVPVDVSVTNGGTLTTNVASVYSFTLATTPVTPIDAGTLPGGRMIFTTVGRTLTDTDMWVFDSSFTPIAGFGSDDAANAVHHAVLQSEISREILTPGVYYLAITDYNLGVNALTPLGDRYQSKAYFDYPGVVSSSNVSGSPAPLNMSFRIVDGSGAVHDHNATKMLAHEVIWVRFTVTAPATGSCCRPDGSCITASTSWCASISGVYGGDGSSCGGCAQPLTGACCQQDGTCIIANAFNCTVYPGAYRGNGVSCIPGGCPKTVVTGTPGVGGGFSGAGAVFVDVTAPATNAVLVTRFDYSGTQAYNNPTPYPVLDVFVRSAGSYLGSEFGPCASAYEPNGWIINTQVTTNPYPVGGSDAVMSVALASPVEVPAGQTVGFYLLSRAGGIAASSSGQTTFTDGVITVTSDEGRLAAATAPNWATALSTTQQTLRGRVYYTDVNPCRADYNNSGSVTVQDIFDFLVGYFINDPRADVNNSGLPVTVQDIFDFLVFYFAGC